MKDFKRRLAIVLAACMVLTNVMPAFAEETAEIPAVGNEIVQEEITETELDVATPEEALYEDAEIENDDIEEITPSDGDIEEASPSEAYAFIREAVVDGVRITLTADAGVFPENAELYAVKIEDDETKEAIDEAVEKEKGEEDADKNVASDLKFDIKMLADGEEIQPDTSKGSVKVTFALEDVVNDCLDINVYHVKEDAEENLVAETLDVEVEKTGSVSEEEIAEADTEDSEIVEGTLISVETDGFSYYVVELTYNGLTYELPGSGSVQLSEILAYVGIADNAEAAKNKVTKVEISDTDLFSADEDGDDWTITSHQSFTSEEWMKVEFDGLEYEIIVTDPTPASITTWKELQNAIDSATPGEAKTIMLTQDLTASPSDTYISITGNKIITLDLNQKTLDRGLTTAKTDGNVIKVGEGASLTVKNGKITGANASNSDGALRGDKTNLLQLNNVRFEDCKGCALSLCDVKCANIEDCTFIGNSGSNGGAIDIKAVSVSDNPKEVTIRNSVFKNNRAITGSGSAIRIYGDHGTNIRVFRYCDVNIINSTFTGNVAEKASDASTICAYRLNSLVLDSCTITENTAVTGSNCAGFSIGGWSDKLTIKGNTVIKDNTVDGKPSDMSLYSKDKTTFKVEGLGQDAKIGIKLKSDIEEGQSCVILEGFNDDYKKCFFVDDPRYQLVSKGGKLSIARPIILDLTSDKDEYTIGETLKLTATIVGADGTKVYFVVSGETYIVESNNGEAFIAIPSPFTEPGKYFVTAKVGDSFKETEVTVKSSTSGSGSTYTLYTGTTEKPVTNGSWIQNPDGTWSYTTSRKFTSTWGCVANPAEGGKANWYYFDSNSKMLVGWHKLYWNGAYRWFYFSEKKDATYGACQLGGITPDGYVLNPDGSWKEN